MPNHVQNRIQFIGKPEVIKLLRMSIENANTENGVMSPISFNKIIPCPEELHITSDGNLMPLENQFSNYGTMKDHLDEMRKRDRPQDYENFIQGVRNYLNHGHATWYGWNVKNWGTKWDAYSQPNKRNTDDTIFFETAWSAPIPVIKELSKQFPDIRITLTWADEDSGSNTGQIQFQNGTEVVTDKPVNQSNEAYELYFELHPDDKERFEFMNGKWQYKEEEEA